MARFRAFIKGRFDSHAARLGDEASGIVAEVTGLESGVTVHACVEAGRDVFRVYRNGGRWAAQARELLCTLAPDEPRD
jgi:hypothetical protein